MLKFGTCRDASVMSYCLVPAHSYFAEIRSFGMIHRHAASMSPLLQCSLELLVKRVVLSLHFHSVSMLIYRT